MQFSHFKIWQNLFIYTRKEVLVMLLNDLIPNIKLSEDSVKKSYINFRKEIFKIENRGYFASINPSNLKDVDSSFKNELSLSIYHSLVKKDVICYEKIFFGIRQYKRYVFCIDSRNYLNQEIQKNINCKPIQLDFEGKSYLFYLILNISDLDNFFSAFFRLVNTFDDQLD